MRDAWFEIGGRGVAATVVEVLSMWTDPHHRGSISQYVELITGVSVQALRRVVDVYWAVVSDAAPGCWHPLMPVIAWGDERHALAS